MDRHILSAGDHESRCTNLAERVIRRVIARYETQLVIVHGYSSGVDAAFEDAAQAARIATEPHPITGVERNYFKHRAGPLRNARMVKPGADLCIVVHCNLGTSPEAKDLAAQSLALTLALRLRCTTMHSTSSRSLSSHPPRDHPVVLTKAADSFESMLFEQCDGAVVEKGIGDGSPGDILRIALHCAAA